MATSAGAARRRQAAIASTLASREEVDATAAEVEARSASSTSAALEEGDAGTGPRQAVEAPERQVEGVEPVVDGPGRRRRPRVGPEDRDRAPLTARQRALPGRPGGRDHEAGTSWFVGQEARGEPALLEAVGGPVPGDVQGVEPLSLHL